MTPKPTFLVNDGGDKEPWQMTSQEWDNEVKALRQTQIENWNKSGRKGFPPTLKINTVAMRTILAEKAGYILPREANIVVHKTYHRLSVEAALKEGKPVPPKVLNQYLDKPKKSRPSLLPPDAQNIQDLSFNSDKFTCYGKPTGRGFRAYCRKKNNNFLSIPPSLPLLWRGGWTNIGGKYHD